MGRPVPAADLPGSNTVPEHDLPDSFAPMVIKSPTILDMLKQDAGNVLAGAVRGAGSIGATILAPYDMAKDAIGGKGLSLDANRQRRASIDEGLQSMGADPESTLYKAGKLGGEIAGTAGVGGAMANGLRAVSQAPRVMALANALQTGGMRAGNVPGMQNALTRVAGGALSGGAQAGIVDPQDAASGALIGGAMPTAFKVAGETGKLINRAGQSVAGKLGIKPRPVVSQSVADLYQKAKSLGIDIPSDRIVNNRPLNALSASLNYMPFSGRMATEDKMFSQLNRALSRTVGQDSDNVTMSLRNAAKDLGGKFDDTLKNNTLKVDEQFVNDLVKHEQTAMSELDDKSAQIIKNQIDTILGKVGPDGSIDGQAAYNIKKTLDRIGNRNSSEAYYARDLKKSLMGALNRSLGPDKAAEFSRVRQQYGNMLDLEGLAQNGAEGGISVGRLANMKHINNQELQDLADISAQFLKSRENPHGAMQRVMMGGLGTAAAGAGAATGTLPLVGGALAAGRGLNSVLNSNALKNALADRPEFFRGLLDFASDPVVRSLPLLGSSGLISAGQ